MLDRGRSGSRQARARCVQGQCTTVVGSAVETCEAGIFGHRRSRRRRGMLAANVFDVDQEEELSMRAARKEDAEETQQEVRTAITYLRRSLHCN